MANTCSSKNSKRTSTRSQGSTAAGSSHQKRLRKEGKSGSGAHGGSRKQASRKRPRTLTNTDSSSSDKSNGCSNSNQREEASPNPTNTQTGRARQEDVKNEGVGFNLENFESHLDSWSLSELRSTLQKKKYGTSNRLPPDVQAKLELLQQNYMKSKLMLALVGNVAEKTVTKFL
ncbi:hypothetical protein PtA15_7A823 [Puccinia triticina]|uniref:Uncharacterized protein n=1 Tax=Puccinia triticina TaxID=208348 RepID=A0ABY7CSZ7_9BASI|nr:uncharacterized protein PtA15_7A823 [Puccinia triticina]WAQ87092.1 hypothetical protein PtA15_7A823 [Puccinia triticina]